MAQVDSWYGYKVSETEAEIVITGSGFGSVPGDLKLAKTAGGGAQAVILLWTDTAIVAAADANEDYKQLILRVPDESGKLGRPVHRPLPNTARPTTTPTIPWSGLTFTATEDFLEVDGTGLVGNVGRVVLRDNVPTPALYDMPFIENGTKIEVPWPGQFNGEIEGVDLVSADFQNVERVEAPAGGWSPASPVVENSIGALAGQTPVVRIFGTAFGAAPGSVALRKDGEANFSQRIIRSWFDSYVEVEAEAGATYAEVVLITAAGVTADVSASHPATFSVPSIPILLTYNQTGSAPNYQFTATGSGLAGVARIILGMNAGTITVYNPAVWGATAAANYNAGNFINNPPTWTDTEVVFEMTRPAADGYMSGKTALGAAALSITGQTLASLDFPDFAIVS